jgi:DNA helicase-2/ATP-dependent DNA helicase PcrA
MQYEQLTPSQRKAVLHHEGPLLVIAGPGSGKTRVITYRIASLIDSGVAPHNICAITFTNKAAEEMRQRAYALGTQAGTHISTFHSLCARILRTYAEQADISGSFSVYDAADQARCIKQAVKLCELDTTNFPPARMLDAISTLKNKLIDADAFKHNADDFFSRTLAKIYESYQNILNENNALDFDDLLMKTSSLLENCPEVCEKLSNRFKFLLIDEYQDTNHAQYRVAKALVSQHGNICVTGDPDQSIYRWRGADIRNILDFEDDWPDAVVVKLEENFRSTPNILSIADCLIACNQSRKQKKLVPTIPPGNDVSIEPFEDERHEADAIAQQISQLADRKVSLSSIAVFYRVNAMSRTLEEAFIRHKIPYQIVRGVEFYSRKEIRDLLAYLKILVNPDDEIALMRIINTPARGIGKTTLNKVRDHAASHNTTFYKALKDAAKIKSLSNAPKAKIAVFLSLIDQFQKELSGGVGPLAEKVFRDCGLEKSLKTAEDSTAIENINELINAAHEYDKQTEEPSLADYLQQISLFSDVDAYDTTKGVVALMTLHAAKGLEFENVFIVGLEEGLLPHERSNVDEDNEQLEEERRLFFVGITRAKSNLQISYAQYRTIRGQLLRTIPSRFLFELGTQFSESQKVHDRHYDYDTSQVTSGFEIGQLVRHHSFGLGRVKNFVDMGENSIIVVKFNTGQTKSLMVKYANLSIV